MYSKVYLRSDGIHYQPRGGDSDIVGYICGRDPYAIHARIKVVQDSVNWRLWCASNWESVPHDNLWMECTRNEWFVSQIKFHNLDFRGTPFEHRHNEYVFRLRYWDGRSYLYDIENMILLSEQERVTWGSRYAAFVPFKSPNPQGYQGVWGDFDKALGYLWHGIRVHDAFDSGIHALKVGRSGNGEQ